MRRATILMLAILAVARAESAVTYRDVLASPDDPRVNFEYAEGRAAAGDLLAAIAALERVLAVAPGHASSRLLMASLLARVGRAEEADEELALLDSEALPLAVRQAARTLRSRLAGPRRLSLDGTLGVGGEWTSNANYASRTGQALLFGAPVSLSPASQRREDAALVSFARLDGRFAVGRSRSLSLVGGASTFRVDRRDLPDRDLAGVSGRFGPSWRSGRAESSAQATFDHLALDRATFLRTRGAAVRLAGRLGKGSSAWLEGRGLYEDFGRPPAAPSSPQRNGPRWDVSVGGAWGRGPGWRVEAGFRHTEKLAASDVNAYRRDGLDGAVSWEAAGGASIRANAGVDFDAYVKEDPVVSTRRRRDTLGRYGLSAGTPLGFLHRALESASLSASFERLESASSLLTYSFTEDRASLVGSWRWSLR